jgi:phage terminase large subunit-like protein
MGQGLYELLRGVNLRLYPSDELRAQPLNVVAVESSRGYRLAKEKATKKIDAMVALSMACVEALNAPKYVPARLW